MKIKINKNRKPFFFYLVLLDFVIAIQIAAVSIFSSNTTNFGGNWMSESFTLSFSSALFVFLIFSGMFKNSKRIKSVIRPGLVFMIVGSLASFCLNTPSLFTFGRTICGMGAGMLVAGQLGIIWHEDFKKSKIFFLGSSWRICTRTGFWSGVCHCPGRPGVFGAQSCFSFGNNISSSRGDGNHNRKVCRNLQRYP